MAMRNYRAMNPEKLEKCWEELRAQQGDAYERVVAKGEDYESHLNACQAAARMKGVRTKTELIEHADGSTTIQAADPNNGNALQERENALTFGLVKPITPMLAYDVNGDFGRVPKDGWVMEPKFDGWRWMVHITKHGVASVGGRNGKRHDGAAPQVDAWLVDNLPAGTVLDGEILWEDGSPSRQVAQYVAFDVLVLADNIDTMKMPWEDRRSVLEDLVVPNRRAAHTDDGVPVNVSPVIDVSEEAFDQWMKLGAEGCVAKRKNCPYLPGSRRQDGWVKVKPQMTTDAVVKGFEMGKGAGNQDRVGALLVELVETGQQTSCGYDATLEEASALSGKIIELAHYGFTEVGKVRHPIMKRLRPDLEPAA